MTGVVSTPEGVPGAAPRLAPRPRPRPRLPGGCPLEAVELLVAIGTRLADGRPPVALEMDSGVSEGVAAASVLMLEGPPNWLPRFAPPRWSPREGRPLLLGTPRLGEIRGGMFLGPELRYEGKDGGCGKKDKRDQQDMY